MIFSINLIIAVLALCGFFVAKHIRDHKVKDKPLVCMVGFDCQAVVHSDYSKIFGIPVEMLGMVYYLLLSFFYVLLTLAPEMFPSIMANVLILVSAGALIFSAYLIIVQIFILKKGCSWCFVSALISILIFALSVIK